MNAETPRAETLQRLQDSTSAMIRTVDALTGTQFREPSLLPDWSRAHVVAHLALNAEGLAGVLEGLAHDRVVPMYASTEGRDADIEELSGADQATLRERLLSSCTVFRDRVALVPTTAWTQQVRRTPDGPTFAADQILAMRAREVEIHHVDLDAGYRRASWPAGFVVDLLDSATVDRAADGPFTVRATDLDREWQAGGSGGPAVSGTAADLGWWLTGRGHGDGLKVDGGTLPALGPWGRAPAR